MAFFAYFPTDFSWGLAITFLGTTFIFFESTIFFLFLAYATTFAAFYFVLLVTFAVEFINLVTFSVIWGLFPWRTDFLDASRTFLRVTPAYSFFYIALVLGATVLVATFFCAFFDFADLLVDYSLTSVLLDSAGAADSGWPTGKEA